MTPPLMCKVFSLKKVVYIGSMTILNMSLLQSLEPFKKLLLVVGGGGWGGGG